MNGSELWPRSIRCAGAGRACFFAPFPFLKFCHAFALCCASDSSSACRVGHGSQRLPSWLAAINLIAALRVKTVRAQQHAGGRDDTRAWARTARCFPLNCFRSFFFRAFVASSSSSFTRSFFGTCTPSRESKVSCESATAAALRGRPARKSVCEDVKTHL